MNSMNDEFKEVISYFMSKFQSRNNHNYPIFIRTQAEEDSVNVNENPIAVPHADPVFNHDHSIFIRTQAEEDSVNVNENPIAVPHADPVFNHDHSIFIRTQAEEDSVNVNENPIAVPHADPVFNQTQGGVYRPQQEQSVNINENLNSEFGAVPSFYQTSDNNEYVMTGVNYPTYLEALIAFEENANVELNDDPVILSTYVEDSGIDNECEIERSVDPGFNGNNLEDIDFAASGEDPGFNRTDGEDSDNVNENAIADLGDDPVYVGVSDNLNENKNASSADIAHMEIVSKINTNSVTDPKDEVSHSDFEILKCLGNGSFGKVFLVRKIGGVDNRKLYAMKVLQKNVAVQDLVTIKNTRSEREILETIRGQPFLVTMHYAFQTDTELNFVLDYVAGGDLFDHLYTIKNFSVNQVRFFAAEIVTAIETLHRLHIVYRDIKIENMLLDAGGHIVITDFGTSKQFTSLRERANTFCGTEQYMAPEIATSTQYTFPVDWWAIGILAFELLTSSTPFDSYGPEDQMLNRIINEEPFIPSTLMGDVANFIISLLVKDPKQRLGAGGADEVKNHEFLRNIDWNAVKTKQIISPYVPVVDDEVDTQNFRTSSTDLPNVILSDPPPEQINSPYVPVVDDEVDTQNFPTSSTDLPNVILSGPPAEQINSPYVPVVDDEVDTQNFRTSSTDLPNVILSGPPPEHAKTFFQGFEFVAPDIVKANRYYRKINKKENEKIVKPVVPQTINDPTTDEALEFISQNPTFFNKYKFVNTIPIGNCGAYSLCLKCVNITTNDVYACKILNTMPTTSNEIEKLVKCQNHINIVNCVDFIEEEKYTFIIMELLQGENILERCVRQRCYQENEINIIFQQILMATEFIHSKNIAHCDLNLKNFIFISSDSWQLKLIDFSSAIYVHKDNMPTILKPTFTLECSAPEIIQFYEQELQIIENTMNNAAAAANANYRCLKECDLWSIGIMLYRLMCDEYPFYSKPYSYDIIKEQILSGEIVSNCYSDKEKFNSEIDVNVKLLIQQLLKINPAERLTITEIRQNNWYKAFNECRIEPTNDSNVPACNEQLGRENITYEIYESFGNQNRPHTSKNNVMLNSNTKTTIITDNLTEYTITVPPELNNNKSGNCKNVIRQKVNKYKFKTSDGDGNVRRSLRTPKQTDFYQVSVKKSVKKRKPKKFCDNQAKIRIIDDDIKEFYGFPSHNDSVFYEPIKFDPEYFYGFNSPYEFDRIKYYSFHHKQYMRSVKQEKN